MRVGMRKFYILAGFLLAYTAFKFTQLFPHHFVLAILAVIPLYLATLSAQYVYRSNSAVFEKRWFKVLAWSGSTLMGLWATFVLLSLPVDFVRLASVALPTTLFAGSGVLPEARAFLSHGAPLVLLGLSAGAAFLGYLQVASGPKVKSIFLPSPSPQFADLKLVQISDLHVGTTVRLGYVREVVRRANALEPDFIFLTGDIADARSESIVEHMKPLADLKARFGVFYVTGNHEFYWGATSLVQHMRQLGMHVLLNEGQTVQLPGAQVFIAGVVDPAAERFPLKNNIRKMDLPRASAEMPSPHKMPIYKIMLSHRPDCFMEAEQLGYNLQLSGHTHAGQFFPFTLLIPFVHKYYRGLYRHEKMWLYVNPGTGYWGPANRFGVAPEITLLTLKE